MKTKLDLTLVLILFALINSPPAVLAADITWINASGGAWTNRFNWNPNVVPGPADNAIINVGGQPTVTLDELVTVAGFALGNGTLAGTGTLIVTNSFTWSAGALIGPGTNVISATATSTISGPALKQISQRTINNAGTVLWTATATLDIGNGAIFNNQTGATFTIQNDQVFGNGFVGGPCTFNNAGTLRKTAGAGTSTFGAAFNNSGTVQVQSGTLRLTGGSIHSGSVAVEMGAALDFWGGTHELGAGSSLNATGTNIFSGGTTTINGSYLVDGVVLVAGGTVNFSNNAATATLLFVSGHITGPGTVTVSGALDWTGGAFTGSGTNIIPTNVTLTISGPAPKQMSQRTINNAGTVLWTATATLDIGGGAVFNNQTGATFTIQNDQVFGNGFVGGPSTFNNAGTLRKTAGAGTSTFGGNFNNYGAVELQSGTLSLSGGGAHAGSFDVPASTTLNLSGGTHTSSAGSSITGAGNLTVSGGTAALAGLVNLSGSNTFSSGTANLTGNYICTNNTLSISGGTANFDSTGTVAPAVVNLSSGTLGGGSVVTVTSLMNWTGGAMTGPGTNVIEATASLTISGPAPKQMSQRTINNAGTVLWTATATLDIGGGAVFNNQTGATFTIQNDQVFGNGFVGGPSTFNNAGTVRKAVGTGTSIFGSAFNNTGTMEIQAGTLRFIGPSFNHAAGAIVQGSGTLNVSQTTITTAGEYRPGNPLGTLSVIGNLQQSASGVIRIELGGRMAGVDYDQLIITGNTALNGALRVFRVGGFTPSLGDVFEVVRYASRTGWFDSISGLDIGGGLFLRPTFTATNLLLTVVDTRPPLAFGPSTRLPNGHAKFILTNTAGQSFLIQASTNLSLMQWAPVVTNLDSGALFEFVDADTRNFPQRYFRALLLP